MKKKNFDVLDLINNELTVGSVVKTKKGKAMVTVISNTFVKAIYEEGFVKQIPFEKIKKVIFLSPVMNNEDDIDDEGDLSEKKRAFDRLIKKDVNEDYRDDADELRDEKYILVNNTTEEILELGDRKKYSKDDVIKDYGFLLSINDEILVLNNIKDKIVKQIIIN